MTCSLKDQIFYNKTSLFLLYIYTIIVSTFVKKATDKKENFAYLIVKQNFWNVHYELGVFLSIVLSLKELTV
jgi:hypothetical protein